MSEELIPRENKTKDDWLEFIEIQRLSKDRLIRYKINSEERISKTDKEIASLVEKKQSEIVKLEAVNEILQRLSIESNEVEEDRIVRLRKKKLEKKINKELDNFYRWKKDNRGQLSAIVMNRILAGIEKEHLSFNVSFNKYSSDGINEYVNDSINSSIKREHDRNMHRVFRTESADSNSE